MIELYTPATGYPDLEIKIAYGLARVGVEAGSRINIEDLGGFYGVYIDNLNKSKLDDSFRLLARRVLSSEHIFSNIPGITGRSAKNLKYNSENMSLGIYKNLILKSNNKSSENICRHNLRDKVRCVIGLASSNSFHNSRNKIDIVFQPKNPKDKNSPKIPRRPTNPKYICKICALISALGIWSACFMLNLEDKEVIIIPVPQTQKIDHETLIQIFSIQHLLRKERFNHNMPANSLPLIFLSKIPSTSKLFYSFRLFVTVLSRQQGYHVDYINTVDTLPYIQFIENNPFNVAIIDNILYKNAYASMQFLNDFILKKNDQALLRFARSYIQETAYKNVQSVNLLFPDTAKYLLEDIAMIDSKFFGNCSILSLARTLRFFVNEKKYAYADDIRNSKNVKGFAETIAKMLREARLRKERNESIHIPSEDDIQEIFKLAKEDFESVKLTLVILAFSYPSKKEEEVKPC